MVLPWYIFKTQLYFRDFKRYIFNKALTHIFLQQTLRMNGDLNFSAHCWRPLSYTHTHIQRKHYFMKRNKKSPWIIQSVVCGLSPLFHFLWTQSWFREQRLFIARPNCVRGSGKRIFMKINLIKMF